MLLKLIRKKILLNRLIIKAGYFNNFSFKELFAIPNFVNYNRNSPLCEIMFIQGTDKAMYAGQGKHNYTPIYHSFFKKNRNSKIRLFELGIGTLNPNIIANMGPNGKPGASLRGWKEYFNNGEIFGADIDKSILFDEERIKTFYCDQTDSDSIRLLWENESNLQSEFDFIIDDGLHTFEANRVFLENSFYKLKINGMYIIEDVSYSEVNNWMIYLNVPTIRGFHFKFLFLKIPNIFNPHDNNLIILFRK